MSDKKRPLFSLQEEEEVRTEAVLRKDRKKKESVPDYEQDSDIRRVVIVGIDIPMTNIILLFLKLFLVVIPVLFILGALVGVVLELATHGTL